MKLVVVYLAAFGFLVSAVAHVAAICGVVLGGEGLFIAYFGGVFLVCIPTVFTMSRKSSNGSREFTWSEALRHWPAPLRPLFYGMVFYALGNFIFLWTQGAKMRHRVGDPLSAETARGFSGHAMVFYMASLALMFSLHREEIRAKNKLPEPTAPSGRGSS